MDDKPIEAWSPSGREHSKGALLTVVGDIADRDLYSQASSVLLVHTDSGGLCGGCMEFAARLSWWPCLQVEWAQAAVKALTEASSPGDGAGPKRGPE